MTSAIPIPIELRSIRHDATAMARLRQLLAEADVAPLSALDDDEVIAMAGDLLHHGRLHLGAVPALRLSRLVVRAGAPAAATATTAVTPGRLRTRSPSPVDDPVTLDWIEIRLLDADAQPLAGERYRIKLPDGSFRRGSLDEQGSARINDIPGGACEVCFPEIDGREWKPR